MHMMHNDKYLQPPGNCRQTFMAYLALALSSFIVLDSWSGRISGENIICLQQTRSSAEARRLPDPP